MDRVTEASDLFSCIWRELRSEISPWDSVDPRTPGFDGFSRYWCPLAVFDVYWVAESEGAGEITAYLTSDMRVTGFKAPLDFVLSEEELGRLALHVGWKNTVVNVLRAIDDEN